MSYPAIYKALSDPQDKGLVGTVEFYPEEGKYHYDGHRSCQCRMHPKQTIANKGLCFECGKPVTVGVMARVEELADHEGGRRSPRWRPFTSLIPLAEIIGAAKGVGPNSKTVQTVYWKMLRELGNELTILSDIPINEIQRIGGTLVAEGIDRVREGKVEIAAGYDGEFGTVKIFTEQERTSPKEQLTLF